MNPLQPLIQSLSQLPGIGEKTATRLALYIFRDGKGLIHELIDSLQFVTSEVKFCDVCQDLTQESRCSVCNDPTRDTSLLCVVQEPVDKLMIEKTGNYRGTYYVLQGGLSPMEGIDPEDLRSQKLFERITKPLNDVFVQEVIFATNPNTEGEATYLYLKEKLSAHPVIVSRIASGIPVGGLIEYSDVKTLSKSLENRSSS